jgi:hypothetical protein
MNRRQFLDGLAKVVVAAGCFPVAAVRAALSSVASAIPLPSGSINELRAAITSSEGTIFVPGNQPADIFKVFNSRITTVPQVLVRCKTPDAISKSLQWAQRFGVPLRARSGGHSYEGLSLVDGMVIDVQEQNRISIDTEAKVAGIGAGARLSDINAQLFTKKLGLSAGSCPRVGIAGLTLGGGHGLSSRKLGLTCDNLRSLKMIDASGNLLQASANEHPDLFWASRGGGGGNFGIVTEFEFDVHPVNNVLVFYLEWKPVMTARVLAPWQEIAPVAPDELTCHLTIDIGKTGIQALHCGGQLLPKSPGETPSVADLNRMLSPLLAIPHTSYTPIPRTFLVAAEHFYGKDPKQIYFKAKSDYADQPLGAAQLADMVKRLNQPKWPSGSQGAVSVIFEAYGGAIGRVASDATAFPHRKQTLYCAQYYAEWSAAEQTSNRLKQLNYVYESIHPNFSGYAYVNYADLDLEDWQRAYYRENLTRLRQVKSTYDPTNVFNSPQSIPPA